MISRAVMAEMVVFMVKRKWVGDATNGAGKVTRRERGRAKLARTEKERESGAAAAGARVLEA